MSDKFYIEESIYLGSPKTVSERYTVEIRCYAGTVDEKYFEDNINDDYKYNYYGPYNSLNAAKEAFTDLFGMNK
jgi:hypothetical protein